ncbi:MAG TPA: hypothetical protein VK565_05540 [Gemmatimonadaceae bacterium]|nr:hypothetical protein [Gemmatimonadaceae bacterium]
MSGEIEHRGIRKLLNFQPDATQHGVDVERALCRPTIPTHFRPLVQGVVQTIIALLASIATARAELIQ